MATIAKTKYYLVRIYKSKYIYKNMNGIIYFNEDGDWLRSMCISEQGLIDEFVATGEGSVRRISEAKAFELLL